MRLLVFADLHLDAAFAWAGKDGARKRRQAIRDTLVNILELAGQVKPDAILCAGDLYEQDRFTPDTGAFLQSSFERVEVPVYISPGNHDYYAAESLYAQISWPSNVRIFREASLAPVDFVEGVRLWGCAHRKPAGTAGFLETELLVDAGAVNIALFHGSEESGLPFEGDKKSPHAPFRAAQIRDSGLHHAFVGHFHTPSEAESHTYPGNPQPLTFGESGLRGAVVADIEDDGSLRRVWHSVAASPAHDLDVDISSAASFQDVRDLVTEELSGKQGVARISLFGEVACEVEIDVEWLKEVPHELDAAPVFDASHVRSTYNVDAIGREATVRGQFVRDVMDSDDFKGEPERHRVLVTGLRALDGRTDLEVP